MSIPKLAVQSLKRDELQILQIYQSNNQVRIAFDDRDEPERAKAWVILVEEPGEQLCLYVGLYLIDSQERVLYSPGAFAPEMTPELLTQAESFVGDMGFLMEDVRFASASDDEKQQILRINPFFHQAIEDYSSELTDQEKEQGRLHFETSRLRASDDEKYDYFVEQYMTIQSML